MFNDQEFQPLFKRWAASRLKVKPGDIKNVDFGIIYGGHCSTCEYQAFGATIQVVSQRYPSEIEETATSIINELLTMLKEDSDGH